MARSLLRQVLDYFEDSNRPLMLSSLARELGVSSGMLDDMIQYWVAKGKLREVNLNASYCNTCGTQKSCPFIVTMPRMYEIVREGEASLAGCCCMPSGMNETEP